MRIKNKNKRLILIPIAIIIGFVIILLFIPNIQHRLLWRWEIARAYVNGVINPVSAVPTAQVESGPAAPTKPPASQPTTLMTATQAATLVQATPMPTLTPTPLPERVVLDAPVYELQDINNCGPATLTMYLRYYGWEGDQFSVSDIIKPIPQDRNVNVEELDYYIKNYAGWLQTIYRVGGDLELIKKLTSAGIPVMIEEAFYFEESYWPNDDFWGGHYLLITGYDDQKQAFMGQDSFKGANQWNAFSELDQKWQAFNRVYTLIYLPEQEATVKSILGENWDADINRNLALETAKKETETDPENVYTWFNLGSNYVYFEEYDLAAQAYDHARELGWPQRMLRYQFGPFLAYFHSLRTDDLMALTEYALERTPNSEEALLWRGWGLYREGDSQAAISDFEEALIAHPNYLDAQYAINFMQAN